MLTGREREILQLLADGMSNADVAARLFISQETVKSHVRHILTKLEADTRTRWRLRFAKRSSTRAAVLVGVVAAAALLALAGAAAERTGWPTAASASPSSPLRRSRSPSFERGRKRPSGHDMRIS